MCLSSWMVEVWRLVIPHSITIIKDARHIVNYILVCRKPGTHGTFSETGDRRNVFRFSPQNTGDRRNVFRFSPNPGTKPGDRPHVPRVLCLLNLGNVGSVPGILAPRSEEHTS